MLKDDLIRVNHMLAAAREAIGFARGHTRASLEGNRLLTLALLKAIEIIGEAAAHVGDDTQAKYSAIPWAAVIGMRNRLIHTYFNINLDLVWDTVTRDLPPLITELEKIPLPEPRK